MWFHPVRAQNPDSLGIDTPALPVPIVDSVGGLPLHRGFDADSSSRALVAYPARHAELDLSSFLGSESGIMPYSFGTAGWPSSASMYGLDPNKIDLRLGGHLVNDLVTGRPRFDLVPYALLTNLVVEPNAHSATFGVHLSTLSFPAAPTTNVRYHSSNTGLQLINAVHSQKRRISLFGQNDLLGVVFGYSGAGADGEYPGSRLERARQIATRIRLDSRLWSFQILELYNRRSIGAHGGVLPRPGQPYSSIYQRLGADVRNEEARRTSIRNDLSVEARTYLLNSPFSISTFWTAQTSEYRSDADTVLARVGRLGASISQQFPGMQNGAKVTATFWNDFVLSGNAFGPFKGGTPNGRPSNRSFLEAVSEGYSAFGPVLVKGNMGLHVDDGNAYTSAAVQIIHGAVHAGVSSTGVRNSWLEHTGFGGSSNPLETVPVSRITRLLFGANHGFGVISVDATAYYLVVTDKTSWVLDDETGSITEHSLSGTFSSSGVALELSIRKLAMRGIYGSIKPNIQRLAYSGNEPVGLTETKATPDFWVSGRLGIRALLFKADLDLDFSIRGFYWDSMVGRRLDPRTGLLLLPASDTKTVPASATFDLVAEAGVRTATLFIAYENMFSNTGALVGNLLVPDYPLPAKRFRFGVFWPISN